MKAIVGNGSGEIAPRLLGFLSLAQQTDLRCDVLRGENGELCVVPLQGEGPRFAEGGPRQWVEATERGDRVEFADGRGFRVVETLRSVNALEVATSVAVSAAPDPLWRQRVLFALPDEQILGRVVRALLEREHGHLTFGRVARDSLHPGTEFLLLVRAAPTYVALEVLEEGLGYAFYEATHARDRDRLLGLFLPWGQQFPLVAALGARLGSTCVRRVDGKFVALDTEAFEPLDARLSPELPAKLVTIGREPAGALRIVVPLRLSRLDPAQTAEPAELWHVRPDLVARLATELACPEDRLDGLQAQVVRMGDQPELHVFVWAPMAPDEPGTGPGLIDVPSFARARRRLPGLLLPAQHAVLPTLRDDTLRRVFGLVEGMLTVVDCAPDGELVQYRLRCDDFRPLRAALVEYALALHRVELTAICETATFDFEPIRLPSEAPSVEEPTPAAVVTSAKFEAPPEQPNPAPLSQPSTSPAASHPLTPSAEPPDPSPPPPSLSALTETIEAIAGGDAHERDWLGFLQASLGAARVQDARIAVLHLLPRCERARARSILGAALGSRDPGRARQSITGLATRGESVFTRDEALEQVLFLVLAAFDPPGDLTPDERQALAALVAQIAPLELPRLTWTAACAVQALTRDDSVLRDARLTIERGLLTLELRGSAPDLVVERIEARNAEANRAAVEGFAEQLSLGSVARLWLRTAYLLRLAALGMTVEAQALDAIARSVEEARSELEQSAEQILTVVRAIERMRTTGQGLEIPSHGTDAQGRLRTVLIEEGYLPPLHGSETTRTLTRARALAAQQDADAADGLPRLFEEVASSNAGLEGLGTSIARFARGGHKGALEALGARVAAARSEVGASDGMRQLLLACLEVAISCALEPTIDPGARVSELVELVARLGRFDATTGAVCLLSAIEPLRVDLRRPCAAALYAALRVAGVVGELSRREAVLVHEQRLLLRLVQLLVVPADDAPEADRIRRAEWRELRETMRRDLQRLSAEPTPDNRNPNQRTHP